MYDRMVKEHGYSIRRLAQKLGKDKGYLENRLRLAGAPPEIQELVSVRKDTISHAYELLKVEDPKKRRRLAEQVARGELTLVKLRERVEGRRRPPQVQEPADESSTSASTPAESPPLQAPLDATPPRCRCRLDWHHPPIRGCAVRGLAGQCQAGAGRRPRSVRRDPQGARRARLDRHRRPGQPRQVPDHRQAPPRERDRARPQRRPRVARRRGSEQAAPHQPITQPAATTPSPIAPASQPRSRRAPDGEPARTRPTTTSPRPAAVASQAPRSAPTAASDPTAPTATRPSSPALSQRARRAPSRTAGVATPAARSRSMSARPLSRATPAPATTASGTSSPKAAGIRPVAPTQAKTGSSGRPTANGSHAQPVVLSRMS